MTIRDNQLKNKKELDKKLKKIDKVKIDESMVVDNDEASNISSEEKIVELKDKIAGMEEEMKTFRTMFDEHNHDDINSLRLEVFDNIICKRATLTDVLNLEAEDYGGGTTDPVGSPEASTSPQEGWLYCRVNYDVGSEDNVRIYIGSAWRSIITT